MLQKLQLEFLVSKSFSEFLRILLLNNQKNENKIVGGDEVAATIFKEREGCMLNPHRLRYRKSAITVGIN